MATNHYSIKIKVLYYFIMVKFTTNFLRNLLEAKGYQFNTRSDGEVICHYMMNIKQNYFQCDGMFAIAIWDTKKETYFARDTAGEKPLYYYLQRVMN